MNYFGNEDPFGGGGPANFLAGFGGFGGGIGPHRRRPPQQYDEYMKAYSVAMLPGRERTNLSYGGKVIMPPSALANLTALDLESPWMFKLSNPANPAASTHAGVLEFIAEEGCVHLPYWMMKTLRLNEGDPIRITGAELPKGKLIKLQAQSVHFLEISDPKAVLEHALRNFSALTQGDIIEISYNSIVFELKILEATPGGSGISVLDTDLEVDFAAPVGYVEPERPKPPPPSTMASKLKIDLDSSTPGSSRPNSALSGAFAGATAAAGQTVSKGGDQWESFKGRGETLSGRKTKGRGISQRKIEDHMEGSKIIRTDKQRIVSNNSLDSSAGAPAPLNLPPGKLFFGFKHVPFVKKDEGNPSSTASTSPSASAAGPSSGAPSIPAPASASASASTAAPPHPIAFSGTGNTLSNSFGSSVSKLGSTLSKGKGKDKEVSHTSPTSPRSSTNRHTLGGGPQRTVNPARHAAPVQLGAGGARVPRQPTRSGTGAGAGGGKGKQKQRSPTPDWGVDDDDVINVDSD